MHRQFPAEGSGLRDLTPLFCGFEDCAPGHAFGPGVREYWLIHHVHRGRGIFLCGGEEYRVGPGQCFLICPGEVTFYRADEAEPWDYTWAAFAGDLAPGLLSAAGLDRDHPVLSSPAVSAQFSALRGRMRTGFEGVSEYALLSFLYAVFAALPRRQGGLSRREEYVRRVRHFIASGYADRLTAESVAAFCSLDRRYLCRIFKESTGFTLQEYILDVRLGKARALLVSTALSVGDISRSVGYADVYNFSKMFKKRFGLSPQHYRQQRAACPQGSGD